MSELPLESGRRWERDPTFETATGVNEMYWVRDLDEPDVLAHFKYPSADAHHASLYSIGIERVAYELASILDLPVPETYLEEIDGQLGVVTLPAGGRAWEHFADDVIQAVEFADKDRWPLYIGFDILLGNIDRHPRNIFLEWQRPPERPDRGEDRCSVSLIDFGFSGLWPPVKFNPNAPNADIEQIDVDAQIHRDFVNHLRTQMPRRYKNSFPISADERRGQVLEILGGITDDQVEAAVATVPDSYISARAREHTVAWLCGRCLTLDRLVAEVFPV